MCSMGKAIKIFPRARLHSLSNQSWELRFDFLFCFTIFNDCFAAVSNIRANFSRMPMLIFPTQ